MAHESKREIDVPGKKRVANTKKKTNKQKKKGLPQKKRQRKLLRRKRTLLEPGALIVGNYSRFREKSPYSNFRKKKGIGKRRGEVRKKKRNFKTRRTFFFLVFNVFRIFFWGKKQTVFGKVELETSGLIIGGDKKCFYLYVMCKNLCAK